MKKFGIFTLSFLLIFVFAGCGKDESTKNDSTNTNEAKTTETTAKETTITAEEPKDDEMCAFCNMKVHAQGDKMGAYTTQALTSDGKHLFFDDSGCLANGPRQSNETYEKQWVRDYTTKEWIEKDKAIIIKSDIATPMKYGYSFFATQENADQFLSEHKDQHAVLTTWEEVDQEANKRYQKKMQKMNHDNNTETEHHDEGNDMHN